MRDELDVRTDLQVIASRIIAESDILDVEKPTKTGMRRLRKLTLEMEKIGKEYRKTSLDVEKRRAELKLLVENCDNGNKVVDKVYNNFESRTCKNCKYIKTTYAPTCDLGVVSQGLFGNGVVTLDFGCNKFERKVEEG